MSIFANCGKWFVNGESYTNRKTRLEKIELLAKYFNISCYYNEYGSSSGNAYDTLTVKTENLTSINIKYTNYSGESKNNIVVNGTTINFTNGATVTPCIYTAEADNTDIVAFSNDDMTKCVCFTFIHGNTADIIPITAEILILRIIDTENSVDTTTIYRSSAAESGQTHTAVNGGYCDKYILTPFVYRGIISDSAFTIEGGKAFVPNLIPFKIGNKNYFSIAKDICISIDNLIGG